MVVRLSPTRRFRLSAKEAYGDWWLRFNEREGDGPWRLDRTPGLRLPSTDLAGFRDLLLVALRREGLRAPRLELADITDSYRGLAEEGDAEALVIVRVVEALALAFRDDASVVSDFLTMADAYLRRKRPQATPLGAGDPRIKRPGRTPAAAEVLLRVAKPIATTREAPLDAVELAQGYTDSFDIYAEHLAWSIERLFPQLPFVCDISLAQRGTETLAHALRKMNVRTPERVVRAALRAFGMPENTVRNFFAYKAKNK